MVLALIGAAETILAKLMSDLHLKSRLDATIEPMSVLGDLTNFLKALTDLIKALATSPPWLACFIVGALIDLGGFYVLKYVA